MYGYYGPFKPYVRVADKKIKAQKKIAELRRSGVEVKPIEEFTGAIAKTFWGKNWCKNLESFADYENRLGRGRSYVRNGFICHLDITKGHITALVNGSELYEVEVNIKILSQTRWKEVCNKCQGHISSLVELLQGKFSKEVMAILSDPEEGIYPTPKEIKFSCSCPDFASLCKHIAAVLYAIGHRLDTEPELLFTLRGVDPTDMLPQNLDFATSNEDDLQVADMGALFDIDLATDATSEQDTTSHAKTPSTTGNNMKVPGSPKRKTILSSRFKYVNKSNSTEDSTNQETSEPSEAEHLDTLAHQEEPQTETPIHDAPTPQADTSPEPTASTPNVEEQAPVTTDKLKDQTMTAEQDTQNEAQENPVEAAATAETKFPHGLLKATRPTGSAIKKLHKLSNLTLEEFASKVQVSVQTVKRWEATRGVLRLRSENLTELLSFQKQLLQDMGLTQPESEDEQPTNAAEPTLDPQ
ncbi:MAG: SWIM zinc finger family protein [Desulfovibrionaceae bacterium]|nr:SWIM zinc finger family protein [Desulfovibrionaceae bacterium]